MTSNNARRPSQEQVAVFGFDVADDGLDSREILN